MNAQLKVRHGLLLGGGKGSLCDVNYIWKGYGTDGLTDINITSGVSSYKLNAALGYKLRLENRDKNRWFYDVDFGFTLKNINFSSEGTYMDKEGQTFFIKPHGSYTPISFAIGVSAGYKIYKGFYAGIGIEPTCYFYDQSEFIKVFDAPLIGKIGHDFKFFDVAITYKNGLLNALQSDRFSKGRVNDFQVQLFIPF
jgi:hypothetical protein